MGMRDYLFRMKQKTFFLNYGRKIVGEWGSAFLNQRAFEEPKVLDLGLGEGWDLENIRNGSVNADIRLYGIETWEPNVLIARSKGIEVFNVDIERQTLPFGDASLDLVVANQIIEHTKEIFWIFSEIARVLKPGGACIVGIPNLASFHNRMLLLLGRQPTTIELLGPHIRGITAPSFKRFVTAGGFFQIKDMTGENFYPFPVPIGSALAKLAPLMSVALFFMLVRTSEQGSFLRLLDENFYETPYYRGELSEQRHAL